MDDPPNYENIQTLELHVPPLEELCEVLASGLNRNFKDVKVRVVQCPDLTKPPFNCAAPGLCGDPRIADVGGVPYLIPVPRTQKVYDLCRVAEAVGMPGAFIIGAGAASPGVVGVNAELMPNLLAPCGDRGLVNRSWHARLRPKGGGEGGGEELEPITEPYHSCESALLTNLLLCRGSPGEVVEVCAAGRHGDLDLVANLRGALLARYGSRPVGMAGVVLMEEGVARVHVMPGFSPRPLLTEEDVQQWLRFFNASAPLVCQAVFVSLDPGLDLRVEHTHCYSNHGDGGHYHGDVGGCPVRYRGYLVPAGQIHRVDRPIQTHSVGRD